MSTQTQERVHAYAFNTLTEMLGLDQPFVPLSVREAIARAIVAAVEPLIREDEREHCLGLAREILPVFAHTAGGNFSALVPGNVYGNWCARAREDGR